MLDHAAADEPRHLHWSSLLSSVGDSLRQMWGLAAGGAFLAASGQWIWVVPLVAASILMTFIGAFIRWRTFTYRVEADEIRIDSGLLSRNHRSIPYDRIQDVDISQGPVARLLEVAKVKFETGSSAGKGQEDGVLSAVPLDEAQQLRLIVRARRSGASLAASEASESPVESAEAEPLFAMDNKRLLLTGLFNFSLTLFAGLFGASQTFGDVIGFDPLARSFWRDMEQVIGPAADFLLLHRIAAAIGGLILLVVVGLATGVIRTVLRDYGFRIDRTESGIRRRRGLLTKTDVTLQLRRVQAAVIGSGPIRSAFGWRDLKLQSLAQGESGENDHLVAPLATADEVDGLLDALRFGPTGAFSGWRQVSNAYLLAFLLGTAPFYLVAIGQAFMFLWLGLGLAGALLIVQAMRWLAWKRTAYRLEQDRLLIRTGWWSRRTSILPVGNIQSIDLSESFVSRWFGTASLSFGVAGGTGHEIPAIHRESARALRAKLLSIAP